MRRPAAVLFILCAALAACSSEEDASPSASPSVGTADLDAVEQRWTALTEQQRERVCAHAGSQDGSADLPGALKRLQEYGHSEDEAAEMLPYVMNECT